MNTKLYELALICVPGVGAQTAKTLVSYCGSAEEVFRSSRKSLEQIPGIGEQIIDNIQDPEILAKAEGELEKMNTQGLQLIYYHEPDYPQRLRPFFDCPVGLFYKGNQSLNPPRMLSVIGTRKPTREGLAFCDQLIADLAPYQPVIVSGLAYGIDICAHRAALREGLPTIGAMAHGHQYLYPAAHRNVADKMTQAGGLLSEYPSFVYPEKEYFPMRNRIVAGMCDALIVIETAAKGGSIITANLANGYNKEVFAVPGRVNDQRSQGCNQLIKSHRACLLETAKDIAYILGWNKPKGNVVQQQVLFEELPADQKNIVDLLRDHSPLHIDQLIYTTGENSSSMAAILLDLECKGVVQSLPGKRYQLQR